jgi:hypothetical protein
MAHRVVSLPRSKRDDDAIPGFDTNWSVIEGANFGSLLFVHNDTGRGATALVDGEGNYTTVSSISGFSAGWTHVTGTSNGGVFFYDASTGDAATASVDAAGTYTFVGSLPRLVTGWTLITGD